MIVTEALGFWGWIRATLDVLFDPKLIPVLTASLAGIWALVLFSKSNRVKATEILLHLEAEYRQHQEILLEIELTPVYRSSIAPLLVKVSGPRGHLAVLDHNEKRLLLRLDAMLRHFYTTYHARHLRSELAISDRACKHYLRLMTHPRRELLANYIEGNWPSLTEWSRLIGQPIPRRLWLQFTSWLRRMHRSWVRGSPDLTPLEDDPAPPEAPRG